MLSRKRSFGRSAVRWIKSLFIGREQSFTNASLKVSNPGLLSTFKETLTGRFACMKHFELDEKAFFDLSDKVLLDWCSVAVGPKNKRQDLLAFDQIQIEKHVDTDHSKSLFVAKFDTLSYNFELLVNDVQRAILANRQKQRLLWRPYHQKRCAQVGSLFSLTARSEESSNLRLAAAAAPLRRQRRRSFCTCSVGIGDIRRVMAATAAATT
jgi:hypothetical protein